MLLLEVSLLSVVEPGRWRGEGGRGEEEESVLLGLFSPCNTHTFVHCVYSPIEIERGGRKREILHDHNDMYILHLCKNLIT